MLDLAYIEIAILLLENEPCEDGTGQAVLRSESCPISTFFLETYTSNPGSAHRDYEPKIWHIDFEKWFSWLEQTSWSLANGRQCSLRANVAGAEEYMCVIEQASTLNLLLNSVLDAGHVEAGPRVGAPILTFNAVPTSPIPVPADPPAIPIMPGSVEAPISLSDEPGVATGTDDGKSIASGEGEDERVRRIVMALAEDNGEDLWPATAEFFCHNPANKDKVIKLHGTNETLRAYQANDVYRLLTMHHEGSAPGSGAGPLLGKGAILAHTMGVGKTITSLATAAARHLVLWSRKQAEEAWDSDDPGRKAKHLARNAESGQCPSANPLGIQCFCVPGGRTREIAAALVDGPTLVVTPSNIAILNEWRKAAGKYLGKLFRVEVWGSGEASATARTARLANVRLSPADLKLKLRGDKTKMADLAIDDMPTGSYYYTPKPGQSHYVYLFSASCLNQGSRGFLTANSVRVDVPVDGRASKVSINFPLAFSVGMLIYDEWHLAKALDTIVMQAILKWVKMATRGVAPPLLVFASGTPIKRSPKDLLAPLYLLQAWGEEGTEVRQRVTGALDRFDQVSTSAGEGVAAPEVEFRRLLEQHVKPFFLRRTHSDTFFGVVNVRLPELRINYVNCPTPDPLVGLAARLAETVRREIDDSAKRTITASAAQVLLQSNRDFSKLLLAANFPSLLRLADDVVGNLPITSDDLGTYGDEVEGAVAGQLGELARDSVKLEKVERIIREAMADKSPPVPPTEDDSYAGRPKNVVVFAVRPFVAYVAYLHCRQKLRNEAEMILVASGMTEKKRNEELARFMESGNRTKVLFSTVQLLGQGTNGLHCANYCIMLGLPWSPADMQQAYCRVHRGGQVFPVHVRALYDSANPAENAVHLRHESRSALARSIFFSAAPVAASGSHGQSDGAGTGASKSG